MKKMLLALFVTGSMLSTTSTWAGKSDQVIMTEAAQNMVTVAEAKLQKQNNSQMKLRSCSPAQLLEKHIRIIMN